MVRVKASQSVPRSKVSHSQIAKVRNQVIEEKKVSNKSKKSRIDLFEIKNFHEAELFKQ